MKEAEVWTVAVGNAPSIFSMPHIKKKAKAALLLAKEQKGFVGANPQPPRGTLLLYRTENDAKIARNVLQAHGVVCGNNICKVYIDERYLPKEDT